MRRSEITPLKCALALACAASAHAQVVPPGDPVNPIRIDPLPEIVCDPRPGSWRAWLRSPGGELPFHFELQRLGGEDVERLAITIINGPERIDIPSAIFDGCTVTMMMPHYDARIVAELSDDGRRLSGEWTKRTGDSTFAELPFEAAFDAGDPDPRFTPVDTTSPLPEYPPGLFPKTWRVNFESSDDPAVGKFELQNGGRLLGTFLTTTGDYRYLEGSFEQGRLRLSCFDGAHAFLFDASMRVDGTLDGDFWSRDSWHERWTAEPDDSAALPRRDGPDALDRRRRPRRPPLPGSRGRAPLARRPRLPRQGPHHRALRNLVPQLP
jgi:hypothetical protein